MSRHVETRVDIEAPVDTVWSILADVAVCPGWTDQLSFHGQPREGASLPMSVCLFGRRLTVRVHFERIDPGRELRWHGGPTGLFVGTHSFRLFPDSGSRTAVEQSESFAGLAAPLLFPLLQRELTGFYGRINRDLARAAISLAARR